VWRNRCGSIASANGLSSFIRLVGISRRSFWVCAATASASMSTIGKSAWTSRSSATTSTPRSSVGSRAMIASEAWASLSAPPVANRIVSPPAPAIPAPMISDTGLVGSATMTQGWRFEM